MKCPWHSFCLFPCLQQAKLTVIPRLVPGDTRPNATCSTLPRAGMRRNVSSQRHGCGAHFNLVTDHTSFYERYGWQFYCAAVYPYDVKRVIVRCALQDVCKVRSPHCAEEEPERFIILPNKSINKKRREPNHAAFLIVNADDRYRIVPIIRNQAISLNTPSRGTSGCRYRPFRPQWPGWPVCNPRGAARRRPAGSLFQCRCRYPPH